MTTDDERYLTQAEVAELRGCSVDTVRRDRRDRGRYPNARRATDDPNGTWEIPLSDLIAAGDVEPAGRSGEPIDDTLLRSRRDRELDQLRDQLTAERARREGLEDRLADRDEQIAFLRRTLADLMTARAD